MRSSATRLLFVCLAYAAAFNISAQTSDPFALTPPLVSQAITSCGDVAISNGLIDSSATSGRGNILSNGTIKVSGGKVDGDAIAGPGSTVKLSGNGTITGAIASSTAAFPCSIIDLAALSATLASTNDNASIPLTTQQKIAVANNGDFKLSGGDSLTLQAGTYYFHKFTISGGSTLTLAGPVRVLTTSDVSVSGGSVAGASPWQLHFWSTATKFDLGSSTFAGFIYAPSAPVTISGEVISGGVYGGAVTVTGNSHITRTIDDTPPLITIDSPTDGQPLSDLSNVVVRGKVTDPETALTSFTVNGTPVTPASDGTFTVTISLGGVAPAKITAIATNAAGLTSTTSITVTAAMTQILTVPTSLTINQNATGQLRATATYADGTTSDVTSLATWASASTAIATVNGGVVAGVHPGTTTITATLGPLSASSTVTVNAVLQAISVSPSTANLAIGGTQPFMATGTYSDGTTSNLSSAVAWSSTAPTVATIDAHGVATAVAPGTATVRAAQGSVTGSATVNVIAQPTITSVQPARGKTAGGDTVTITGTNFTGSVTVTFGGTQATVASSSATSLSVTTPAHVTGVVDIVVTTAGGAVTASGAYTYIAPPSVTAITPTVGKASGGDSVSITGTNFDTAGTSLTIGGSPATNVVVVSSMSLTATTPAAAVGGADVVVTTAGGTAKLSNGFTFIPAPVITSISPTQALPGASLTIVGANFDPLPANNLVTFGGAPAVVTSAGAAQLVVTVPANATSGTVQVSTVGGSAASAQVFTVLTYQTLTVSPTSLTLQTGAQQQLSASAVLSDGTTVDVTQSATWISAAPAIATVTAGAVSGVAVGATSLTASIGSLSASATVTVAPVLQSIAVSPATATVTIPGSSKQAFSATATYSDGTTKDVTASASWSSTSTGTATIDTTGVATALSAGTTTIQAMIGAVSGSATLIVQSVPPPTITSLAPVSGRTPGGDVVTISGTGFGTTTDTTVTFGSVSASITSITSTTIVVTSPPHAAGVVSVTVTNAGGSASLPSGFQYRNGPVISSFTPPTGPIGTLVTITGQGFNTPAVTFGGVPATVSTSTPTAIVVAVPVGAVTGPLSVTTADGSSLSAAPFVVQSVTQLNVSPSETSVSAGQSVQLSATAVLTDGTTIDVTSQASWAVSEPWFASVNSAGLVAGLAGGDTTVQASFSGQTGRATLHVVQTLVLPPDPMTIAPPLNTQTPPTPYDEFKFLFSGSNAIQVGVAANAIIPGRTALVRGRVFSASYQPLGGVSVTVFGHPELGTATSRADGNYEIVVNGGGVTSLVLSHTGLMTAMRDVPVGPLETTGVDDVLLLPYDTNVTHVAIGSGVPQLADGGVVNDASGSRQAHVFFPSGVTATLKMPDGSTRSATDLHVRATEYTVGPNGVRSMPALLPPMSGYTYCAELSVDEAVVVGATSVTFNKQVAIYVDNFLHFSVGAQVPVGYYDRGRGTWSSSDNGRVGKVLSITNGMADLDMDGDGTADSATQLSSLGITTDERTLIASRYAAGSTFWRALVTHFTPYDLNWPYGFPPDAVGPYGPGDPGDPAFQALVAGGCKLPGSIVDCLNQSLGERIGIQGTPWTLNYQSQRMTGQAATRTLTVQLTPPSIPASLKRVDLTIAVAGQTVSQSFSPAANQQYVYQWNGRDVFGRPIVGSRPRVRARVSYVYDGVYQGAKPGQGFAIASVGTVSADKARLEISASRDWQGYLPNFNFDPQTFEFGGWSLSSHHVYDPIGGSVYLGTGETISARTLDAAQTIAGSGCSSVDLGGTCTGGFSGDGGPAILARLSFPSGLAAASDGSLYVITSRRIRRIDPSGIITTVAGNGNTGTTGEGVSATQTPISPLRLTIARDGSIYFSDATNKVRKVAPNGIITTFAGNGTSGATGDGGPATSASMQSPYHVAFAPDGSLYIQETSRIRRVTPDGIISTFLAIPQNPNSPSDISVAFAPDGSLYYTLSTASGGYLHRIGTDGKDTQIPLTSGDPGGTWFEIASVSDAVVGPDGSVYVSQLDQDKVRKITPSGVVTTIAGPWDQYQREGFSGDGGPANDASFAGPFGMAILPSGTIAISDELNHRIRAIGEVGPPATLTVTVPSRDGSEAYVFSGAGQHLRTVDAYTGITLNTFSYDANGRLTSIAGLNSGVTTIERDSGGLPTAIVAPGGQRTALTVGSSGLSTLSNSAGESNQFSYNAAGLLSQLTDTRSGIHIFTYDASGRLTKDDGPAGSSLSLSRTGTPSNITISSTTGENRQSVLGFQQNASMQSTRSATGPDGLTTVISENPDGSRSATSPTGTTATVSIAPDPRFGMDAPIVSSMTVKTPSGLAMQTTTSRSVTLAVATDPLSVTSLSHTSTINGRSFGSTYTASNSTLLYTSPLGRTRTITLDQSGRPSTLQAPGLATITPTYESHGLLTSIAVGSRHTSFAYDGHLRLQSITDSLLHTTSFDYDQADRIAHQTLADGRIVAFTYDAAGNTTSVTPPSRPAHAFTFTTAQLLATYVAPTVGSSGATTSFTYNADRQLTGVARPDGATVSFTYDSAGRLSKISEPFGVHQYSYDSTKGTLTSVSSPDGGSVGFTYDGELLKTVSWTGSLTGGIAFTYDNNFRVISEAVNGGGSIAFGYDNDDLLVTAGALALRRDPGNGLLMGTTLANLTDSYSYNQYGEPASYAVSIGGSQIIGVNYTRDDIGRIVQKSETANGQTAVTSYSYDATGRLTDVTTSAGTSHYGYDDNGNRTLIQTSQGSSTATYDDQDRLVGNDSGASYTYSASGDLLSKTDATGTTQYTYDSFGNLRHVSLPTGTMLDYVIDAMNRRVGKKVNGVLVTGWLYDDDLRIVAETDGTGAVTKQFVYGAGRNLPDYLITSGTTYRIVSDHLGSPRYVLEATGGTLAQALTYDEFGMVQSDSRPGFQPFGFAGGLYDPDTKLVRLGSRDYDAATGRWTTKDPLGFGGRTTNLYLYAGGDPVNIADPSGKLFHGMINAGENYGSAAVASWADLATDPTTPGIMKVVAWIGGAAAALWTPCTSDKTFTTLSLAEGASQYLYRPLWQYYPELNEAYQSQYATRGWGWSPPYTVPEDAAARLALPEYNPATAVREVQMNPWEYYRGPSIVEAANGQPGGGVEYNGPF